MSVTERKELMKSLDLKVRQGNRTNHYLELLQKKHGLSNAAQLASHLGVSRVAVGRWFYGEQHLSDEVCLKVAADLQLDPSVVLAEMQAERTNGEVSDAWRSLAKNLTAVGGAQALAEANGAADTRGLIQAFATLLDAKDGYQKQAKEALMGLLETLPLAQEKSPADQIGEASSWRKRMFSLLRSVTYALQSPLDHRGRDPVLVS